MLWANKLIINVRLVGIGIFSILILEVVLKILRVELKVDLIINSLDTLKALRTVTRSCNKLIVC